MITALTNEELIVFKLIKDRYNKPNSDPQTSFDVNYLIKIIDRLDDMVVSQFSSEIEPAMDKTFQDSFKDILA